MKTLLCAEHVMKHRLATIQATGAEPVFDADALAAMPAADTVFQGLALCLGCLQTMTQIQHVSALVGSNGHQLVVPPGAPR
jgi:hypothetical protein